MRRVVVTMRMKAERQADVSDVFQPEQVVGGRYRVVRKLGGGGMADVYLCEDLTLGRHVAIKVLLQRYLDDPTFVERFRREAKAAAGLNQQNLVSIYDWGEVDGTYYIVMEYVEGETLKDLIRRRGRLSGNEAVAVALQLLAAIDFAHRSGIVHRDIKPQNVMLDRAGTVKVMDFGIARAGDSGMTEAGSILGTAQYLAPEQAKGHPVDERSDLYSVGVVLYEMLTGTVPFKGDSAVTVALKHVNEVPREPSELVPGMPYALNQIVLKAMAKHPADRYQSAAEFARDLRAAKEGGPLRRPPSTPAASARASWARRRRAAAGTTSVLDQPLTPRRKKSRWPLVLIILLARHHRRRRRRSVVDDERQQGGGARRGRPEQSGRRQALEKAGFKAARPGGVLRPRRRRVREPSGAHQRHQDARGRHRRHLGEQGQPEGRRSPDFRGGRRAPWTTGCRRTTWWASRHTGKSNAVADGPGVQAGPGAGDAARPRRHGHVLGQQRQAASHGARPDQPDAGGRRRRWPTPGCSAPSRRAPARRCRPGRSSARTRPPARRSTRDRR